MTEDENSDDSFTKHLEYDEFGYPVLFRVACEGKQTIIPSYEIGEVVMGEKHELQSDIERDCIGGGLESGEDIWWGFAFDGATIENPQDVIDDVETLLKNYNRPPEDLSEEGKQEWRQSTVVITDVIGLE